MNPIALSIQDARPGGLLRMIATQLSARGLPGGYCHDDGGSLLRVTGLTGLHCTVIAEDSGYVLADCWPAGPPAPDPAALAATAMRVLGDQNDWQPGPQVSDPDLTLLGRVGLALRATGLSVALDVQADERNFEVYAQLVVTRLGQSWRGQVRIGDDGALSWEYDDPHISDPAHRALQIADMLAVLAGGT
ncbi:MAG TPA: hypothetical protein VH637_03175 [Streptosporangiaceae bacterium]